MQAVMVQRGDTIDFTPGGDLAAGDVVQIGNFVGVAVDAIPSGVQGAVSVKGVYTFPKATGGGTALATGVQVFWDAGNARVTTTGGTNKPVGVVVKDALDADTRVSVRLSGMGGALYPVGGATAGLRIAAGEVTLDGANPTPVVTGLTTIVGGNASLKKATSPGDDPTQVTVDYGGGVTAGTLNIYAWKTDGADPTLVASTNNTQVVSWTAVGT